MNPLESSAEPPPRRRRQRNHPPLDRDWLEQRALRYAARWETSAAGVALHLERKVRERCEETGESPADSLDLIPWVVERLLERGYVDDERYAATTIDRMCKRGRSTAQIESRLRDKGIAESIYRKWIERIDADHDSRAAWQLARRRRIGPFCSDPARREHERERHLGMLARRGFDRETAERVIDSETLPEPS